MASQLGKHLSIVAVNCLIAAGQPVLDSVVLLEQLSELFTEEIRKYDQELLRTLQARLQEESREEARRAEILDLTPHEKQQRDLDKLNDFLRGL